MVLAERLGRSTAGSRKGACSSGTLRRRCPPCRPDRGRPVLTCLDRCEGFFSPKAAQVTSRPVPWTSVTTHGHGAASLASRRIARVLSSLQRQTFLAFQSTPFDRAEESFLRLDQCQSGRTGRRRRSGRHEFAATGHDEPARATGALTWTPSRSRMSRNRDLAGPHGLPSDPRQPRTAGHGPSPLDSYSLGGSAGAYGGASSLPPHTKSSAPAFGAGGVPPHRPQRNAARRMSPSPGQGSFVPPPAGLTKESPPIRKDSRRGPRDVGYDNRLPGSIGVNGHGHGHLNGRSAGGAVPAIMEPSGSRSGGGSDDNPAMRVGPSSNRLFRALQQDGTIPIREAPPPPSPALSDDSTQFVDASSALRPSDAAGHPDSRPGSRQSNRSNRSSVSSDRDLLDPADLPPPDLAKLQRDAPQVLQNVLQAFEQGGRDRGQRRDVENARRPPPGSASRVEAPGGRARRTAVANQGYNAKHLAGQKAAGGGRRLSKLDDRSYPLTPGFRELEKALKQIHQDWKQTGITSGEKLDEDGQDIIEEEKDDEEEIGARERTRAPSTFSPVGLALELIGSEDPSQPISPTSMLNGQSLSSFLRLKAKLEKALQLTIQSNYRQFDASVGGYNLVRQGIDSSQKRVAELRKRLIESREVLGAGSNVVGVGGLGMGNSGEGVSTGRGVEMKSLSTRKDLLDEMLKLLESV